GGFPIGAMLCTEALVGALPQGSHGTTYGGNPLASAAALAVLGTVESQALVKRARELGASLETRLVAIAQKHTGIDCVRGRGLLLGLVLRDPAQGAHLLAALRIA